jgi:hypothetical protein
MTFFEWMRQQVKRDDPIGDLAGDMVTDAKLNNLTIQTVDEWKEHIWFQTDRAEVRKAFRLARDEYNAQLKP